MTTAIDCLKQEVEKECFDLPHEELVKIMFFHAMPMKKQDELETFIKSLSDKGKLVFSKTMMMLLISKLNKEEKKQ